MAVVGSCDGPRDPAYTQATPGTLPGMHHLTDEGHRRPRVRDASTAARLLAAGETWPTMAADLRRMVPRWHFEMLADTARNTALIDAINTTVEPGDLVLDIGTGAGLTALAAARRGANVVTCEVNPIVAELARAAIAANGYSDTINVVNCPSTDLGTVHLPRPADVLVAEVFDADLFGEGAVPTIDDARSRLLTDNARILPHSATVFCGLVSSTDLHGLNRVGAVDGFDLSAFNRVATDGVLFASVASHEWAALSVPAPLFGLDFTAPAVPAAGTAVVSAAWSGLLHAIVVWFELNLGGDVVLSNTPGRRSHWKQAVYVVDEQHVDAGDHVEIGWRHNTRTLVVELAT